MDRIVYDRMADHDNRHWWYVARRDILAEIIGREINLPADSRILEIGCGTGHNLEMLGRFGQVDAIEVDDDVRQIAAERLGRAVWSSPLPELEGVEHGRYDLIAILDVLEHINKDREALRGMAACLKPGGKILITVPAFPWLWSAHDIVNHHHRRYTKSTLRAAVAEAGLTLHRLDWFNSILFPLAVSARMWGKLRRKDDSDDAMPPAPLNALFRALFGFERHLIGRVPMPPGVSLLAIVSA
ncbi:class I SAM-dependent methyltransferase [Aquisediminimonas profunda]|uniref:class I SAM-dependent methyltransferase n=1 Tax=Aquisediminimonas profunda TaxID=1550733 RepID=UPI001C631A96|nr:class I SAM-dependent methyltransferase [Aquisediminimonas profunda]